MKKSADQKVQDFISQTMMIDHAKYQVLEDLRKIVFKHFPEVKERVMYGGIMLSLPEDVGGIFVYKNHVSFEFGNGVNFNDPEKVLEGSGKFRRHLKIKSIEDITEKKADYFIKQMGGSDK